MDSLSIRMQYEVSLLSVHPNEPVTPAFMSELASRMQRWYVNTIHHFYSSLPVISIKEAWVRESVHFSPFIHTRPNLFLFIEYMFLNENAEFCSTAAMFGLVDVLRYSAIQMRSNCDESTIHAAIKSTWPGGVDCLRFAHETMKCVWSVDQSISMANPNEPNGMACLKYMNAIRLQVLTV
jgi:hypothetical protein